MEKVNIERKTMGWTTGDGKREHERVAQVEWKGTKGEELT